jgi:hypothetical protein
MKRLAISLVLGAAALAILAPSASAKYTFFESPSGNIGCVINGGGVRCDIQHHSWPTPPKPASCDVDYGEGVAVGKRDVPANFVCAGDTVFDPDAEVLRYGERIRIKRFRCASKQKGMRCVNRDNKHGFFLSSQDVRLF